MYRFMFLPFLVEGLFFMSAGVGLAEESPEAILNKAIKAHGGEEKLAAIKAVKIESEGTAPDQNGDEDVDLEFTRETVFLLPDNYKSLMVLNSESLGKLRIVELFTKGKGTVSVIGASGPGGGLSENLTGDKLINLRSKMRQMQFTFLPVFLRDNAFRLSSLSETKVGDKPALRIKVRAKERRNIELFFDKVTSLLVKTSYRCIGDEGKEVIVEHEVTEHQKIDGITVPKKIEERRNGVYWGKEEFLTVELLKSLNEKEFQIVR